MSRYRVPPAANDEGKAPQIRVEGLDSPPLFVAEVEIFDALISTIADLAEANDQGPGPADHRRGRLPSRPDAFE